MQHLSFYVHLLGNCATGISNQHFCFALHISPGTNTHACSLDHTPVSYKHMHRSLGDDSRTSDAGPAEGVLAGRVRGYGELRDAVARERLVNRALVAMLQSAVAARVSVDTMNASNGVVNGAMAFEAGVGVDSDSSRMQRAGAVGDASDGPSPVKANCATPSRQVLSGAAVVDQRRHEEELASIRDLLSQCQLDLDMARARESAAKMQARRLQEQVSVSETTLNCGNAMVVQGR